MKHRDMRLMSPAGQAAPAERLVTVEPEESDPTRGLGMSLLRAREVVMSDVRPVLRRHGLTDQQWRILRYLHLNPPLSPAALSRMTAILLPSLLRMLTVMEAEGLLRRAQDRGGPGKVVSLSTKGKHLLETVRPQVVVARAAIRQRLTHAELDVLRALLRKLYLRPDEYGAESPDASQDV